MFPEWIWLDFDGVVARRNASRSLLVSNALGIDKDICRQAYYNQLALDPVWRRRSLAVTTIAAEKRLFLDVFTDLARRMSKTVPQAELLRIVDEFMFTNRFALASDWAEFVKFCQQRDIILGLLSNGYPTRRKLELAALPIESDFGDIIISSEVGLEKPDPAIYELALSRNKLSAGSCWYVDNEAAMLAPARQLEFGRVLLLGNEATGDAVSSLMQLVAELG
jgi:HAD superfamily hydrolase (TIGR01549 family)